MPRFSKPENAPAEETVRKVQRKPKCSRCRNHGFVVTLKGHSGGCPFGLCRCWKCSLITQRTSIMASHRRMKKAHRLECRRASESREVRSRAGGGSGPDHAGGEAGPAVSSSSPVRTQSVTRMTPPQLEAPGCGGACSEVKVRRSPQTHSAVAGTDVGLGALGLGGSDATVTGREIPRWSPANPHFRVDSASAEVFQRELYLGELMTVSVPVKPLTCYPDSYPILALLLNPPLAWPRGLGDLDLRFPQFQPYTVPNSIDTGPSHVRPVPLFIHPIGFPPGVQEEMNLRHFPGPAFHMDGDRRTNKTDVQLHSSQESNDTSVDSDLSTQSTL